MPGTELDRARHAVTEAMHEAHAASRIVGAHTRQVAGWLHREDGSWAPVDYRGKVGPVFAIGPVDEGHDDGDVFTDAAAALATLGEPVVIDVDPLYSPALQRLLEVAERIARDSDATTVDVEHVEQALTGHRRRGGESPGGPTQ
ncbi:hypothetical protein ACFVAV_22230 [Nocardia sp. NPDC057663]|uniref:hypothetical protein n=1 Tax=Nocardia sp. NPDC057663 TaxID=3346201 RepID=UPI00366C3DC8